MPVGWSVSLIATLTYFITPESLQSEASFLAETAEKANALAPHLAQFESVARDLARGAVKFLVVELYCKEGSALESACLKEDIPYVGISRKVRLSYIRTQQPTHQAPALYMLFQLLPPLLFVAWLMPVLEAERTTRGARRSNVHIHSYTWAFRLQNRENFRQKLLSFFVEQIKECSLARRYLPKCA